MYFRWVGGKFKLLLSRIFVWRNLLYFLMSVIGGGGGEGRQFCIKYDADGSIVVTVTCL